MELGIFAEAVPMHEERLEPYPKVIQDLLGCTSDEEITKVLDANQSLLDARLVEELSQLAADWATQGNESGASFLSNIACQIVIDKGLSILSLQAFPCPSSRFLLLLLLIRAIAESNGNRQLIYPILSANLSRLDGEFTIVLEKWAMTELRKRRGTSALLLAKNIGGLSRRIQDFFLFTNRTELLNIAKAGYMISAEIFTRDTYPDFWMEIQRSLRSILLQELLKTLDKGDQKKVDLLLHKNFDQFDEFFVSALQEWERETVRSSVDFGGLLQQEVDSDRLKNMFSYILNSHPQIKDKITASELLKLMTENQSQILQHSALEIAFLSGKIQNLSLGNRAFNLECAIAGYRAAKQFLDECHADENQILLEIKINLGIAYSQRVRGEKSENLEISANLLLDALQATDVENSPKQWATILTNLGVIFGQRIRENKTENLQRSITCFLNVLKIINRDNEPQEWANVKNNLGIAYLILYRNGFASKEYEEEILKRAIECFEDALSVRTLERFPYQYAQVQMNLGTAYSSFQHDRKNPLEKAIQCYEATLTVWTRDHYPYDWAEAMNNLGKFHTEYSEWAAKENLDKAIAYLSTALEVRSLKSYPHEYALTTANLGIAYQNKQEFKKAYEAFSDALNVIESLRNEITFGSGQDEDKQKLAEQYIPIYQYAVETCLQLNMYDKAIEYIERSKTRNLIELLATRELYPNREIPESVRQILAQLRQQIADVSARLKTDPNLDSAYITKLHQQYRELFPYQPIQLEEIRSLIDDKTAIVQWYIFKDCFRTFVITHQNLQPQIFTSLPGDLEKVSGWLSQYLQSYYESRIANADEVNEQLKLSWRESLGERLQQLAEILHIDEVISCLETEIDQIILIPHLYLHLLPLHALPILSKQQVSASSQESAEDQVYLLDCFSRGVRYAPSCQLLKLSQKQQCLSFSRLFAVQNPTNNLLYADLEVNAISSSFSEIEILSSGNASEAAIKANRNLEEAHCLHFACHGEFNPKSPLESALHLAESAISTDASTTTAKGIEDGFLNLAEIFTLRLQQCRLVTLSACETGLIDFHNASDEYIGLPSGFLYAGAPSVISSLWKVDDFSATFLMIKFYENLRCFSNLRAGEVAVALNQAQVWLRDVTKKELETWIVENNVPVSASLKPVPKLNFYRFLKSLPENAQPFQSPYYWAAFCSIGQ